jgi:hypothetical protein
LEPIRSTVHAVTPAGCKAHLWPSLQPPGPRHTASPPVPPSSRHPAPHAYHLFDRNPGVPAAHFQGASPHKPPSKSRRHPPAAAAGPAVGRRSAVTAHTSFLPCRTGAPSPRPCSAPTFRPTQILWGADRSPPALLCVYEGGTTQGGVHQAGATTRHPSACPVGGYQRLLLLLCQLPLAPSPPTSAPGRCTRRACCRRPKPAP